MLKKIALVLMLALPMGVFAQNLKFGHINAQKSFQQCLNLLRHNLILKH